MATIYDENQEATAPEENQDEVAPTEPIEFEDFGCLTQPSNMPVFAAPPSKPSKMPPGTFGIEAGFKAMIPRWEVTTNPTVLQYFIQKESFEDSGDIANADLVKAHLKEAAGLWNSVGCGVNFAETTDIAKAHFLVAYTTEVQNGVAASAFFPHRVQTLKVYHDGVNDPATKAQLLNSLTHELGHVLGLRHEHAMQTEEGARNPTRTIGERNPDSIMGYRRATRKLQQTDRDGLKMLYSLPNRSHYMGFPVTDFPAQYLE